MCCMIILMCFMSCAGHDRRIDSNERIQSSNSLPDLWIFAVGVNYYKNLTNLRYAVINVSQIINSLTAQKSKIYNKVHYFILSDTANRKPSYKNIVENLAFIKQAKPDDIVVFYYSGHGDINENGIFCLLPADVAFDKDNRAVFQNSIPVDVLKSYLEIPSKKIIILDSCYSGAAIKTLKSPDTIIFASSREDEQSLEWIMSIMTYSIAEGFKGAAAENKIITAESLEKYVKERVSQLSRRIIDEKRIKAGYNPNIIIPNEQNPVVYIPEEMKGFVLGCM